MGVSFVPPNNPNGFEGFEKRLEVEFRDLLGFANPNGLRAIPRSEIECMLSAAECSIVAALSNEHCDSYVLSESSLFVYPLRIVLKTCGTTRLLEAIPILLTSASRISLEACRCSYSRGTFLFPAAQPSPYGKFGEEVMILDKHFQHLGGGTATVMGGDDEWHVYVAAAAQVAPPPTPATKNLVTMEMCMTQLDRSAAALFFRTRSAADMTLLSGIRSLLPQSDICDFAFDPCGYSMNSLEATAAHSTIHVTPEDGFSYASFETMGCCYDPLDLERLVDKVLGCFKPAVFSISLSRRCCGGDEDSSWLSTPPPGYVCSGRTRHETPDGSLVVYHTFRRTPALFPALENKASKDGGREMHLKGGSSSVEVIGPRVRDMESFMRKKIVSSGREDAFYVFDLATVVRLWKLWQCAMPRVHPFYAVKCNPDPQLLSLLAALGAGFDIASKAELEAVSEQLLQHQGGGVRDRVVFANPCKLPSHITEAAAAGVVYTTFDCEGELVKLKRYHPKAELLLRIRADDSGARCPLGVKYGAEMNEWLHLLEVAKDLDVRVAGVAFHVGSGASDGAAFAQGIRSARKVFDLAESVGLPRLTMLDIGGGFVSDGGTGVKFSCAAYEINKALEEHFPLSSSSSGSLKIIAEPGRYFAEEAFGLAALVFGCRVRKNKKAELEYWINDGIYGSMNCLLYDHATLTVRALQLRPPPPAAAESDEDQDDDDDEDDDEGLQLHPSIIFGPTCDGLDTVLTDVWLPRLECGDWLVFPRMGAYTKTAASSFNGFPAPTSTFYVHSGAFD